VIVRGSLRLLVKSLLQFACAGGLYRHHNPPLPHTFFLGGFACLILVALCRIPLCGAARWLVLPPLGGAARWLVLPPLGGLALTGYEYLFGLYFLTKENLRIWNYTGCPHEYRGLICLKFSLCWVGATVGVMLADRLIEHLLRRTRFAYRNMFKKEKAEA